MSKFSSPAEKDFGMAWGRRECMRLWVTASLAIAATFPSPAPAQGNSIIEANVPTGGDFPQFLRRDIASFLARDYGSMFNVSYELLRHQPTQSGTAFPKFYAWVHGTTGRSQVEGAVRLAAIGKQRFEVTDFVSKENIAAHPEKLESIFPADLIAALKDRAAPPAKAAAAGVRWSYRTRISVSYDVARGTKGVAPPVPQRLPYPEYPFELLRARVTGSAAIQFRVIDDGSIADVRVVKSEHDEFSAAVLEAVKSWRFQPITGRSRHVEATFSFEIPED